MRKIFCKEIYATYTRHVNATPSTFGKRLLALLDARDLKQAAFAEMVGTSQANVSRWINDVSIPNAATCKYVAARLGVALEWLLHGHGDGKVHPLKAAREKAGLSVKELSQKTGYAIGVLQAVENGGRASEQLLRKLEEVLPGFHADGVMIESDTPNIIQDNGSEATYGATPRVMSDVGGRCVPVLSFAQAGNYSLVSDDEAWTGESLYAHGVKRNGDAFWLRIEGDSMVPTINQGDQVLVRRDKEPRRGSPVVVKTTRGEVFCKLWHGERDGEAVLASANPAHPELLVPMEQIAFVYPVGEIRHVLI